MSIPEAHRFRADRSPSTLLTPGGANPMTRSRGRRGHGPVIQGETVGRNQGPVSITRGVGAYSIGSIGEAAPEPLDVTFEYFGATFRVHPDMTEVDIIDFLDQAERVRPNDPQALVMVKDAARSHIHPDDFDRFWKTRKDNRQGVQDLMATIWSIIAGVTGRPTGRPSASSDGRAATSQNSPVTSSRPGTDPSPDDDLTARYLRQMERLQTDPERGPNGAAYALQLVTAAEARGLHIPDPSLGPTD
jgi:hypothetical protein